MGLDNGIIARKVNKKEIPAYVKDGYAGNRYIDADVMEVAYWRKCWGIREAIGELSESHDDGYALQYLDFTIDKDIIPEIIEIIYQFLNKEYYDKYADSIWEYEEMKDNLYQQIINLQWLESYMADHPEVEVEFYDSY